VKTSLDAVDVNGRSASTGAYRRLVQYGLGLTVAALIVTPVAGVAAGASYRLFGMVSGAAIMATAIVALLLLLQARALRSVSTAVLGGGFAYAAATMVPYVVLYHGMFPRLSEVLGARPHAPGYLWFLWQTGLLVAVLAYQWLRRSELGEGAARARGPIAIAALFITYAVVTPLAIWLPMLPAAEEDAHWTPVLATFMAPIIVLLAAASIVGTFRSRSRGSVLDVCVGIVSYGLIVEVYLTTIGTASFTIGWYTARLVVLLTTVAVLAVLLLQAAQLYSDLIERAEVFKGEAHTDTLTGVANRRRFDEEFARAFGSAIRRSSPISVAIIDIDRFKNYNDAFGHQAGDEALRRIARAIAESVERSGDFAARYGGEEFVVILEDTTLGGAMGVAERIRNAVLDTGISAPGGGLLSVSVGVAARLPGSTGETLLRQADAALYDAKNGGRNRVCASRSSEGAPVGSAYDAAADGSG
jgi:diguanylate cyclase (GGDEF)-like protein